MWEQVQKKLGVPGTGQPDAATAKAAALHLGVALPKSGLAVDIWKKVQLALGMSDPVGIPAERTLSRLSVRLGLVDSPEPKVKPKDEPSWLAHARTFIGLREIHGPKHHPKILGWAKFIGLSWITTDEEPWCATALGGILEESGVPSTKSARARSYSEQPDKFVRLSAPAKGAIVVFWRGNPKGKLGHVTFLAGVDRDGGLWCIGGNQDDEFQMARFNRERLVGFFWPASRMEKEPPSNYPAPVFSRGGRFSTNEA